MNAFVNGLASSIALACILISWPLTTALGICIRLHRWGVSELQRVWRR